MSSLSAPLGPLEVLARAFMGYSSRGPVDASSLEGAHRGEVTEKAISRDLPPSSGTGRPRGCDMGSWW